MWFFLIFALPGLSASARLAYRAQPADSVTSRIGQTLIYAAIFAIILVPLTVAAMVGLMG
jgi:hypothetical protein